MNDARRKELKKATELLSGIEAAYNEAKELIESAKDGEREYADNMPENMKSGERGEQAESAADALEEAFDAMEQFDLSDVISKIEEATA